jgi:glycosyltransferase involved in cell wall biosynthesis
MAKRLQAAGHQVEMVTTVRDSADRTDWFTTVESGVRVHWFPVPYSNRMGFFRRIWAFLQFAWHGYRKAVELKGDVVFATSTPLTIAIPGVFASRKLKIPLVFEVRDLWPELPVAIGALRSPLLIALATRLERWAYKNSAHVIALSPGMKKGVVQTGYPENQVTVIPNSCDLDLFAVAHADAGSKAVKLMPWLGDRQLVVYTGTFGVINGTGYLIRIAAEMRHTNPEIMFLLVGAGADYDANVQLAKDLGVYGVNLHIQKSIPKTELVSTIQRATVATSLFIDLPQMWANSANKFFDALAAGRPVMINYRGWQAELLEESGAGIVVPPQDARGAAAQLLDFLMDKQRLAKASTAAMDLANRKFSRDILARDLISVLEATVQHK